jgi:hypothetical protein
MNGLFGSGPLDGCVLIDGSDEIEVQVLNGRLLRLTGLNLVLGFVGREFIFGGFALHS